MPQIFKALASISVWILFVWGCIALLAGVVRLIGAATGDFTAAALLAIWMPLGAAIVCLFLSVCAMKLRQMLE